MPAYREDNGTWTAKFKYKNFGGEPDQKTKRGFKLRKDALEWERIFKSQFIKSSDIPFNAFMTKYMDDLVQNEKIDVTTAARKQNMIDTKLIPFFKNRPINEILPLDVLNWQTWIRQMGYEEYDEEDGYADTYLRSIHNELSAALNYGVRFYGLPNNAAQLAGPIGSADAEAMQIWSLDEYKLFSSHVVKTPAKVAFDILYWSGAREGELLALTLADFLPNRHMDIHNNFQIVKGKQIIKAPKYYSIRCIPIPDFLYEEVQNYASKLYGLEPTDRLFMFTAAYLRKEIKAAAASADLDVIRVHDLRHSHASLLISMSTSMDTIIALSKRLGHKNVTVTLNTYGHLFANRNHEIVRGLEHANINGLIPGQGTIEAQVYALMNEIKESLPISSNPSYENDDVIVWDSKHKRKNIISYQDLPTMLTLKPDPEAAYKTILNDGYLELTPDTILCFSSRGMPTQYL